MLYQAHRGVSTEYPENTVPAFRATWVRVPMAGTELCVLVKRYASLGLWILETQSQPEEAERLGADIIETAGSLKPRSEV